MIDKEMRDRIFSMASRKGSEMSEIFFRSSRSFTISAHKGKIEKSSDSISAGLSLKTVRKGKAGFAFTEIIDDLHVEMLVEKAILNMQLNDSDYTEALHADTRIRDDSSYYSGHYEKLPVSWAVDTVLEMEKTAHEADPRIVLVPESRFGFFVDETTICNSQGLENYHREDGGYLVVITVASDGRQHKTGFAYDLARVPDRLDRNKTARRAASESSQKLGAESVKSAKYDIILRNDVFGSLLATFIPTMFSAEMVQRGLSPISRSNEDRIASGLLSIYDEPHLIESLSSRPFDDQGVPTRRKALIDEGIQKSLLYDLKTAKKDGVEPTGNALKNGYKGQTQIAPINISVEPGEDSLEELIERTGSGILITSVEGLHSGAKPMSGEFSLGAQGFLIEGGKKTSSVEQITIASDILTILRSVEAVGNDRVFSIPMPRTTITPSVMVSGVDIAGSG